MRGSGDCRRTNRACIGASAMSGNRQAARLLCRTALLCALLCVLSVITVPIGAVPVTLGMLGVFLIGLLLPPRYAALAVLGYLLLGAVGLPVFSSMQGGAGILFGITGGFLWGYLPAVCILSLLRCRIRSAPLVGGICAGLISQLLCYAYGTAQFLFLTKCSLSAALTACVLPFVPFDLCKLSAALYLAHRFRRHL